MSGGTIHAGDEQILTRQETFPGSEARGRGYRQLRKLAPRRLAGYAAADARDGLGAACGREIAERTRQRRLATKILPTSKRRGKVYGSSVSCDRENSP